MRFDNHKKLYRQRGTCEGVRYDLTAKTPEELKIKVALREREIKEGKRRISRNMLVMDWSEEYIKTYRENSGAGDGQIANLRGCKKYIDKFIGKVQLKDVKPAQCINIANSLSKYSRSYAGKIISFMIAMFDAADENDLILRNPARSQKVKVPSMCGSSERRSLTKNEREQFLDFADRYNEFNNEKFGAKDWDDKRNIGLWIKYLIWTGSRPSESARLLGKHIDIQRNRIWIDGTKTEKSKRYVPLPDALQNDLAPFVKKPFKPVFTNAYGDKLTKATCEGMFKAFVRALNISLGAETHRNQIIGVQPVAPDLTTYCLRHEYASHLRRLGVAETVISHLLGHTIDKKRFGTTGNYLHMTESDFENVRNLLNGKKGTTIIGDTQIEIDELQEIINEVKRRKAKKQAVTPRATPRD